MLVVWKAMKKPNYLAKFKREKSIDGYEQRIWLSSIASDFQGQLLD